VELCVLYNIVIKALFLLSTTMFVLSTTENPNAEEPVWLLQPCPLTTITRQMAESVAQNFQALWAYVQDPGQSDDVSVEMKDMLRKFARDAYSVCEHLERYVAKIDLSI